MVVVRGDRVGTICHHSFNKLVLFIDGDMIVFVAISTDVLSLTTPVARLW
jgi:hypothetical protein